MNSCAVIADLYRTLFKRNQEQSYVGLCIVSTMRQSVTESPTYFQDAGRPTAFSATSRKVCIFPKCRRQFQMYVVRDSICVIPELTIVGTRDETILDIGQKGSLMLRMLHSPPKFHRAVYTYIDTDLYDFEICLKREKVNMFYQLYSLYIVLRDFR